MPRTHRPAATAHAFALICAGLVAVAPDACRAATCVWNSAAAPSTRRRTGSAAPTCRAPRPSNSPGATDIALIANGTAQINSNQTVAELELGAGGLLAVVGGSLPSFTVNGALRLNGGGTTTILGTNQLRLILPLGATGTLLAPSTLTRELPREQRQLEPGIGGRRGARLRLAPRGSTTSLAAS